MENNNLADRYDGKKLRWRNFPLFLFRPVANVAHFGESKYTTFNFMKGAPINQYIDCLTRHLDAFVDPEQSDIDESGENHLAHIAWNALVALWVLSHKPELDDRWKPENIAEKSECNLTEGHGSCCGNDFEETIKELK